MDISQVRDLLAQVQNGARVTTAVGEPITVGERVVIPVVEVAYGGGGGGAGKSPQATEAEGQGGGGGGGVRVRPLGCWVIGPHEERWVPAVDTTRAMLIIGSFAMLFLITLRAIMRRR